MKLSVCMITYNHEKYIKQAIDSILMQKVSFDYEIVIGEDCSTDSTKKILLDYQKKNPSKFKLLLHDKNIGIANNFIKTYNACSGQYIAILEGDDYWIDENKLQTQVDFLENNNDTVLCYHRVNIINSKGQLLKTTNSNDKPTTDIKEILSRGWFMHTGTLLFRNFLIFDFPDFFFRYPSTDYILHILLAQHGKISFLNTISGVYRKHPGGITLDFERNIIPFLNKNLLLLDEIDIYLNRNYSKYITELRKNINAQLFIQKLNTKTLKHIFSGFKNLILGNKKTIYNKFKVHFSSR